MDLVNGEHTIVVDIGQRCVACNDIRREMGQLLTMESVVPAGGSGSSGVSKIEVSWVFFGSAWFGVATWRAASGSSSIASSPAGIGVWPCGGGVLVDIGVPVLRVSS